MRSSASSFFFFSLIILRLSGILLLFVLLEKKSSKNFIPFSPLDQFRVFVFFLSLLGRTTDQQQRREGEDAKKDGTLPLSLVFDENNNMEEVFFVVVVVVVVSLRERDLRLFARARGLKHSRALEKSPLCVF